MRSPHTATGERRERHRANQVDALTTNQLQVERGGESHRAYQVYALTPHQLQVERRERHRANRVYVLATHQLHVEEERETIEPIKCMHSPHTSYRWRGERETKRQSSGCTHYTPDTGGEERESYSQSSVCSRHKPATGGE